MTLDFAKVRIFIRPGYTDMRKAVNGLSGIVEQEMAGEVFSGNVYVFCSRDRNGFWLSQKRLEKDRFPWPQTGEAVQELSGEQLSMLLEGIDFFKAHKPVYYKSVS